MRFGVLGPLEVIAEDGPVRLGGQKQANRQPIPDRSANHNRSLSYQAAPIRLSEGRNSCFLLAM